MGLLGGVVSGLLGGGETTPAQNAGALPTLSIPGLSLSLPTLGFPSISLPIPPTPSAPTDSAPASASSALPSSLSSAPPPSSPSLTPSVPASSPPATDAGTPTASLPDTNESSGGSTQTQVISSTVLVAPSTSQTSAVAAPAHAKSFLENKPLSAAVFTLVGLVALVLLFVGATFFLRRRRRSRLLDDALSFDPALTAAAQRYGGAASEKGHASNASLGTTGSAMGQPMQVYGYGATAASVGSHEYYEQQQQQPGYYGQQQQQPEYYGQHADYYGGQQSNFAYVPPMADAPASSSWAVQPSNTQQQQASVPQQQQHSVARVPVPPQLDPLPEEFGSSEDDKRNSAAEEAEFWARTLTVRNE